MKSGKTKRMYTQLKHKMYKFEPEYIIEDGYLQLQECRIFFPRVHIELVQAFLQHPCHSTNQKTILDIQIL